MTCDRCGHPETVGEHGVGLCPLEPRRTWLMVQQDSIEGGLEIHHGLCNEDGTPRTYYSRSEMRQACAAKGLMPWSDVWDSRKTKDAEVRMDWYRSDEAKRQKRDRDEQRREGTYRPGGWTRTTQKQNSEATRQQIKRAVIERLRAYS